MSLPAALKMLRLELGMTQADLAKKLNRGCVTVNRWENGKGFPSRNNARDILSVAKKCDASDECVAYLYDVLMPDSKRLLNASAYGFPDIDREFLFQLADGSTNSVYVIEAGTYNLLYANRSAEKFAERFLADCGFNVSDRALTDQIDKRCFHYFANRSEPCDFCQLGEVGRGGFKNKVITIPESGRVFRMHAKNAKMKNRDVFVVYMTNITERNAEIYGLYELTNDISEGVGIYNLYPDDTIELAFMNTVLFQMIGEERQALLLKNEPVNLCLVHPEDRARLLAKIKEPIHTKRKVEIDMRMRVRDRKYHQIHLYARMLKKDQGKFTFYCLFREPEKRAAADSDRKKENE